MGTGSHKPGEAFKLKCVAKNGLEVTFLSNEVSISAIFHKQEDADYFDIEKEFLVDFMPIAGGHPTGERGSEPQSGY